jgi:PAS domain S-box-containing protein
VNASELVQSASGGEVRILIVEDTPSDATLMLRVLSSSGLRMAHYLVKTEPEFVAALHEFRPDVVLTDNSLPRFSGRLALTLAHEYDPSLPVIMVSGTAREDEMIQLLREGLSDYILKDSLLRLPAAVLDALQLARVQRASARDRAALLASERRFRAVAEASGDGLIVADHNGTIVYANAAAGQLFGCTPTELTGAPLVRVLPDASFDAIAGVLVAPGVAAQATPFTTEVTAVRCDRTPIQLELTASFWEEDGHRFVSAQLRDITARKLEARMHLVLSQVVEQTAESVIITDTTGAIEYVNPAFERLTGYTAVEVIGQTPRLLRSGAQAPETYTQLWHELTHGRSYTAEFQNRRKDGSLYTQRTTIFPIIDDEGRTERYVGLGVDITQERTLEQQLRQAQKMEMVGQLAGGIAHDFNNTLTGVMANAALLDQTLPDDAAEQHELVESVIAAARRGADLVKRLMSLARNKAGPVRRVDLTAAVDEAARTARRLLPESIDIKVSHAGGDLTALLDEGELHQALLNICNNARDAMPLGGRLSLTTHPEGRRAVIEVRDNGVGMEPAIVDRVFEPFFTTKAAGKGTGLGLPMAYGFAKRAGGGIEVRSQPGAGTLVRIWVPLAQPLAPVSPTTTAAADAGTREVRQEQRTILLVEDQDELRKAARRVLERLGHRVLAARDGREALELLLRNRGRLDLVLSDLVLPHGGAEQLYQQTLEWEERPRFLLTSGYAPGDLDSTSSVLRGVPFLPKPWSAAELESAVVGVLAPEGE